MALDTLPHGTKLSSLQWESEGRQRRNALHRASLAGGIATLMMAASLTVEFSTTIHSQEGAAHVRAQTSMFTSALLVSVIATAPSGHSPLMSPCNSDERVRPTPAAQEGVAADRLQRCPSEPLVECDGLRRFSVAPPPAAEGQNLWAARDGMGSQ